METCLWIFLLSFYFLINLVMLLFLNYSTNNLNLLYFFILFVASSHHFHMNCYFFTATTTILLPLQVLQNQLHLLLPPICMP